MAKLDELIEQEIQARNAPRPCKLGVALEEMEATDEQIERLWELPDLTIANMMTKAGHKLSNHVVGRHRRGLCGCDDG